MSTIRLLSWNIHGTFGHNPRYDLAGVVELIDRWQPHIVALQEVDSRRESDVDPFEFLQRELGEHGIGAKSIVTEDGEYGQMLISRWPLSATEIHDISFPEREPRRVIATCIDTPVGTAARGCNASRAFDSRAPGANADFDGARKRPADHNGHYGRLQRLVLARLGTQRAFARFPGPHALPHLSIPMSHAAP